MEKIRSPIITIVGHVDHGKTSLLDRLRESSVVEKEAGRITQKIYFTKFPLEYVKKKCCLLSKYGINLEIPGLLFIDTPGHAAFTNLRKRGGSLADLAILVVDINEGIMLQTAEAIQILKQNKTPFIVALNKIDNIGGWRKRDEDIKQNLEMQGINTKNEFDEKLYKLISSLQFNKLDADLFFNFSDYTKKVALVPISAKTGEGFPELMMILCGLCQKFLKKELELGEKGKGVILEVKKEKGMNCAEAILYDGMLKTGEEIAVASFDKPIVCKIRAIEEIIPLQDKFKSKKEVVAATGLRLQLTNSENILAGMPFQVYDGNLKEIEKDFSSELDEIRTDSQGVIAKADSLGSLEALLLLLRQAGISILKAGIGNITKSDIISAKSSQKENPLNEVIVGFNINLDEEASELSKEVKIILNEVVYKIIEDLKKWRNDKEKEIEREKLMGLATLCKLEVLNQYVFRNSNPAIFGVKVVGGKLKSSVSLISDSDEEIGRVKGMQKEKTRVDEAFVKDEVAISLPGVTFDRQLKDVTFLYSNLSENQFRKFKENKSLLNQDEIKTLQEISALKRKKKITWGV